MLNVSVRMVKKDTVQFNLRPARQLVRRLAELAEKYERDAGTAVALEVLKDYLDLWVVVEDAKIKARQERKEAIRQAVQGEILRQPITEVRLPERNKPEAQRKGKR